MDVIGEHMCEPDLPLTFVPCRFCGQMVPIRATHCDECQGPRPQCVGAVPVRCIRCGDEDGPWAPTDLGLVCEGCLERAA